MFKFRLVCENWLGWLEGWFVKEEILFGGVSRTTVGEGDMSHLRRR